MRKFLLCLLCVSMLSASFMSSATARRAKDAREDLGFYTSASTCAKAKVLDDEHVSLEREDFIQLRATASASRLNSLRLRDIEKAIESIQKVLSGTTKVIKFIKNFLGINIDDDLDAKDDDKKNVEGAVAQAWTDPETGVVMKPGSVGFTVETSDGENFDSHGIDSIDMDVLFNQKLFQIDHIEGEGVEGDSITKGSLSRSQRSFKTRISVPLSDILTDKATFYIFLRPKKRITAKKGQKTKVRIEYYKRVKKEKDGSPGTPPIFFKQVSANNSVEVDQS